MSFVQTRHERSLQRHMEQAAQTKKMVITPIRTSSIFRENTRTDGPYVDITALLYKINGLVGSELGGFLSDQNYAAARGYIKKIQKRPDIRSNFVADEWTALEQYINNEELKNANT